MQELGGEGCRAGGKRLAATDDADYTERENPNAALAEIFGGPSGAG